MAHTTDPSYTPDDADDEFEDDDRVMPRLRPQSWVLIGFGLAALTGIAGWYGIDSGNQPVRWQDVGYTVDSPFEATVTYDVFFYTEEPVVCELRALNVRYAEVGGAQEEIDPAAGSHQRITTALTTTETANTVVVDSCSPVTQ